MCCRERRYCPPSHRPCTMIYRRVPIFLDAEALSEGRRERIYWNSASSTQHHWLIGGNSGSGKSTHLTPCLAKVSRCFPSAQGYIFDFKGSDDFHYLRDIPNARYFIHDKCANGLRLFSEEIESRLQDNPDRTPIFAVFDEFASFISYTSIVDKKLSSQCLMWLMNALFMSRSVGGFCWLCTQRS